MSANEELNLLLEISLVVGVDVKFEVAVFKKILCQ